MLRMTYTRWRTIALSVLLMYFFTGVASETFGTGEFYPVFSWELFSNIPAEVKTFTIQIDEFDGEVYDPPLQFSEMYDFFNALGQSPTDYEQPIVNLGSAIEGGRADEVTQYSEEIGNIFQGAPYTYTVLKVVYDSLEYWETQQFTDVTELGSFSNQ